MCTSITLPSSILTFLSVSCVTSTLGLTQFNLLDPLNQDILMFTLDLTYHWSLVIAFISSISHGLQVKPNNSTTVFPDYILSSQTFYMSFGKQSTVLKLEIIVNLEIFVNKHCSNLILLVTDRYVCCCQENVPTHSGASEISRASERVLGGCDVGCHGNTLSPQEQRELFSVLKEA